MKSWFNALAGVMVGFCFVGGASAQEFVATLTGGSEVPANTSAFVGTATLTLGANGAISCTVTTNVPVITASHIHRAATGVNGPVVVALTVSGSTATCPANAALTPADVVLLQSSGLYFNVHTAAFPGGEIRGQILARPAAPVPSLGAIAMVLLTLTLVAVAANRMRRR